MCPFRPGEGHPPQNVLMTPHAGGNKDQKKSERNKNKLV